MEMKASTYRLALQSLLNRSKYMGTKKKREMTEEQKWFAKYA